jgi:chromosome partitioning protein
MSCILSVVNHKGGVGKTTTTLNLGRALARTGAKTLLVDLDPQGNLSQSYGVHNPERSIYHALCEEEDLAILSMGEGVDMVPSETDLSRAEFQLQGNFNGYFRLKKKLDLVRDNYDYILIDCPPSLGILTVNALIASNEVLIVIESEPLAFKGSQNTVDLIHTIRENMNNTLGICGILITQTNRTVIKRQVAEHIREIYGDRVFSTEIRHNVALTEAKAAGMDIFQYSPESHGAEDYSGLANEVKERTNE